MSCAGTAVFVGAHLIEDVGRRVEDEDLTEVKRCLYLHALAALDNGVTQTQGWLKRVAGEMVRERVKTRRTELNVDFSLSDIKFTYATCRLV